MRLNSLNLRLSIAAVISIVAALTLSGWFLLYLFERHVVRRVDQELSVYIKQLAAEIETGTDGQLALAARLADPRFERPFSGLYWQIDTGEGVVLRSRSLWDDALALEKFEIKERGPLRFERAGPNGETLVVRTRVVFLTKSKSDQAYRLAVAIDKNEITTARLAFTHDLILALGMLALALVAAAWLQIYFGLRPLKHIRERINDVRTGATARLEGEHPSEVDLLVSEVNALLDANDVAVDRARQAAADLAHGLKTPLAVLQAEARKLADQSQNEAAEEVAMQVENMRVRVESHLSIVRIRGRQSGTRALISARKIFDKIVNAMRHMPRGEELTWQVGVNEVLHVAMDEQDFIEVFGIILDNARKWAKASVMIRAEEHSDVVRIEIENDGPPIPVEKLSEILQRGRRLDERKTGAGLGLAIAAGIISAYDGSIHVENSKATPGVVVIVEIPTITPLKI